MTLRDVNYLVRSSALAPAGDVLKIGVRKYLSKIMNRGRLTHFCISGIASSMPKDRRVELSGVKKNLFV